MSYTIGQVEEFITLAHQQGKKVVLKWNISWLDKCSSSPEYTEIFKQLANKYQDSVKCLVINVDESEELTSYCNISGLPTYYQIPINHGLNNPSKTLTGTPLFDTFYQIPITYGSNNPSKTLTEIYQEAPLVNPRIDQLENMFI